MDTMQIPFQGHKNQVQIRTIAFGVVGWIPRFTRKNLGALLKHSHSDKKVDKLVDSLSTKIMNITLKYVAIGHKLWLTERG